jgi:hypothetical protein
MLRLPKATAFTAPLPVHLSANFSTASRVSIAHYFSETISHNSVTMSSSYELPEDFLTGPAPNLERSDIDFAKEGLTEYDGQWAVVLDGVLSEEECEQLVAAAEATTNGEWERAMVNIGGGFQAMIEETRKCGRIIWDNRELMAKLWARIEGSVPEIHRLEKCARITGNGPAKRNEVWKVSRLNERQRFLKYVGGEYFKGMW